MMGRAQGHKTRDRNKASLPQVPKNMKSDGLDVEFDRDLADHDDLEAWRDQKLPMSVLRKNNANDV